MNLLVKTLWEQQKLVVAQVCAIPTHVMNDFLGPMFHLVSWGNLTVTSIQIVST